MNKKAFAQASADMPPNSDTHQGALPPNSRDAEMALLSCLMHRPDYFDKVISRISATDFFYRENQLVFEVIEARIADNVPIDTISLAEHLKRDGDLIQVGDVKYLTQLKMFGASISVDAIESYVASVKEKSHKRKIRLLGLEIANDSLSDEVDAEALLGRVEAEMTSINESNGIQNTEGQHVKESLIRVIDRIDGLFNGEIESYGVPTGFTEFDEVTMGLQPADLIILAGRPSMGKTTFAMNIGENAAIAGKVVQVFSLEMPTDKLTMRMLSSLGRINSGKLKRGALDDTDWPKLSKAVSVMGNMQMYIDDTGGLSIAEFRTRARKAHKKHNLDLIIVDYLQLMKATGKTVNNRTEEVAEISKGLKAVAKELNVPIIALSQLNRGLEQRPNKRPIMSDLRESGSIEQDADIICFVYRDEVYNEDSPDKGKAEIIIGKNRDGEIGMIPLFFEGQYTRFHNIGITADRTIEEGADAGFVIPDEESESKPTLNIDDGAAFDFDDDIEDQSVPGRMPGSDDGLADLPPPPQNESDYFDTDVNTPKSKASSMRNGFNNTL